VQEGVGDIRGGAPLSHETPQDVSHRELSELDSSSPHLSATAKRLETLL
jgi:hypothetical protein